MAASGAKNVGSYGKIRVLVDLVLPQNIGANTSRVRVRGQMALRQGSNAHNNNGVHMKTIASPGGSTTESNPFSVGTSWVTVIDNTYTVSHAADGNRTVTGTFELGATGTTSFGSGGSVSLSLKLKRIPRPPAKPGTPTVSNITSNSARINWSHPNNNGATLEEYQVQRATNSGFTAGVVTASGVTGTSYTRTGLAANTTYWVRIRVRNAAGWSAWSGGRSFTTKVASPAAPTNVSATRVNDGRANISWTRHATTAAPYSSQRVQRSRWDGSARTPWANVATVSGTATSFVDTSISANNDYRYRVQAVNASGTGTSGVSDRVRTTPAAPTGVSAQKQGDDIVVSFSRSTPWVGDSHHEVQDNPGGAGWVTVGTTSNESEFVHANVNPAVSHQYRVRTVDTLNGTLNGVWSTSSNVVQLLAPPLAPIPLSPVGTMDRDEPFVFRWRHNPVDTTDQTEFELEWWLSYQPNNPVTVTGGSEQEVSQSPLGSTNSFSWRVRTKGEYAGANPWSPWSPTQTFNAASRPEVVIQSPEETLEESQVEVEWGYQNADASAQSRWEAQLLDAEDNVLATGSGSDTAASYLFPTILDDATTYTVRVRARAGSGLWSEWDTSTFVTDFPLPYPVEVLPEWDRETGSVAVTFDIDDSNPNEQAPDSVDVQRDDGDGWITIAVGLDPETSIVDHTPRLAEIRYRTISRTTLPTARTGPETVIEWEHGTADPVYVNGGPSFEAVCTAIGHEVTDSPDIEQALQEWAGWEKATAVFGTGESYAIQFRGKIFPNLPHLDGRSTLQEWHALQLRRGIVCYRDCQGRKVFGLLGIGFQTSSSVTNFSLTISEARHVEGVRTVLPVPEDVD